jgi:hypothetical protein
MNHAAAIAMLAGAAKPASLKYVPTQMTALHTEMQPATSPTALVSVNQNSLVKSVSWSGAQE